MVISNPFLPWFLILNHLIDSQAFFFAGWPSGVTGVTLYPARSLFVFVCFMGT